ncbi:MAG: chromate transporter [Lachnospira sp.]
MLYLQLFYEFFKAGLFAIGGGLATLPFMYEISEKTGWFTSMDISNMIAVSESTPGPMGVNMATYVGFMTCSVLGGIIATLGLICPSIIIIIIISNFLKKFKESQVVQKIFYGLRPASTALITVAGLGVAKLALLNTGLFDESGNLMDLFNWVSIALAVVLGFLVFKFKKIHPIAFICLSAVLGIVLQLDTPMF